MSNDSSAFSVKNDDKNSQTEISGLYEPYLSSQELKKRDEKNVPVGERINLIVENNMR